MAAWEPEPYSETVFSNSNETGIRNQLPSAQVRQSGMITVNRKHKTKKQKKNAVKFLANSEVYINKEAFNVPQVSGMAANVVQLADDLTMNDMESLKELTCPMAKKREIRNHLLKNNEHVIKSGFEAWREQRSIKYKRFREDARELLRSTQLWRSSIHEIEGQFGNGIRSYFAFLRWLFHLNVYIFIIVFGFISVPTIIHRNSGTPAASTACTTSYAPYDPDQVYSFSQYVIWWFTGQGFMEDTMLFYGYYEDTAGMRYNLALAYVLVAFAYFGLSLFLLVRRAGRGLKESLVSDENKFYSYCNKLFGGWDFCITDSNAAKLKHSSIKYELETDLEEERIRQRHLNRTRKEKTILYLKRALINILVLVILGVCLFAIYRAADYALQNTGKYKDVNFVLDLLVTYLTSIVITILNFIAPIFFEFLITYEDYTPAFTIKMTLIRTVFLRLASVMFLYVVVYFQINCRQFSFINSNFTEECAYCAGTQCWETYLGQEMYKLSILDFFIVIGVTLFVEFPRRLIVEHCHCRLAQWFGHQEFAIPTNVLDIVYAQTIMWIGTFYAPMLPVIVIIKFFVFFYLKKLTLVYNCRPATRPYRASRSGSFFFIILLFGFAVAAIPVGVGIARIEPSRSCGIYTNQTTMFYSVTETINGFPIVVRDIFWFLGSPGFAVIAGVMLCLILYYFVALKTAHKKMIALLKEQLSLEGKDKQFLLNRVNQLQEQMGSNFGTNPRFRKNGQKPKKIASADSIHNEDEIRPGTSSSSIPGQTEDFQD